MASRRMFAKSITDSARFLRMPAAARLLYFDLGMQADDDGVVEAFTVIRTTGASEDDLKVLKNKGFVSILNDDLVAYICDWEVNNRIRKERHHPSIYINLLEQWKRDNQLSVTCQPDDNQLSVKRQPSDNQLSAQVSLGKASLDKGGIEELPRMGNTAQPVHPTEPQTGEVDKEKQTESVTPASKTVKRFKAPTFEEVKAYCTERDNHVDPQRFMNYYQANGWKVGKNGMKDWRAAVRTWERPKDGESSKNTGKIDYARNEGWTL